MADAQKAQDPLDAIREEFRRVKKEINTLRKQMVDYDNQANARENWADFGTGHGYAYDYYFMGVNKVAPPSPRTSFFLKVPHDGSAATWVAGMPATQDADATTFDIRRVRIYLSGEVAG